MCLRTSSPGRLPPHVIPAERRGHHRREVRLAVGPSCGMGSNPDSGVISQHERQQQQQRYAWWQEKRTLESNRRKGVGPLRRLSRLKLVQHSSGSGLSTSAHEALRAAREFSRLVAPPSSAHTHQAAMWGSLRRTYLPIALLLFNVAERSAKNEFHCGELWRDERRVLPGRSLVLSPAENTDRTRHQRRSHSCATVR